jgi:hypothetical protein
MKEEDSIRTEDQVDTEAFRLALVVEKIGDDSTQRLNELIRVCAEERFANQLAGVLEKRTTKIVGATPMEVPIEYGGKYRDHVRSH